MKKERGKKEGGRKREGKTEKRQERGREEGTQSSPSPRSPRRTPGLRTPGRGFLTPVSPARGPSAVDGAGGSPLLGATCTTAGLREPLPHSALQNFTPSC